MLPSKIIKNSNRNDKIIKIGDMFKLNYSTNKLNIFEYSILNFIQSSHKIKIQVS